MKNLSFIFIALLISLSIHGQVMIGSFEKPVDGALLQLSNITSNNPEKVNANKGLGLPRVMLTKKNKLYPMFETTSGSNIPNEDYDNVTKIEEQNKKHIGLLVYNINKCHFKGEGLYLWDGSEWNKLPNEGLPGSIHFNQNHYDFPSGKDARGEIKSQLLNIDWKLNSGSLSYTKANSIGSGLVFSGANVLPTIPFTTSPATIKLLPDAMTINAASPWQSKETKLIFTDTDCGIIKEVTLNQTNYALKANNSFLSSAILLRDQTDILKDYSFKIKSNLKWKIEIEDPEQILVLSNIPSGTNNTTGSTSTESINSLRISSTNIQNINRFYSANIYFSDTESIKRIHDLKVSVVNCFGKIDYTKIDNTVVNTHTDQDGNPFYSRVFGDAGEWMVTNLKVTKFDSNRNTPSDNITQTLFGPDNAASYDKPLWVYPSELDDQTGSSDAYFTENEITGLLYNWAASTGGIVSNTAVVQGICPFGWHLPSNSEWIQLENEYLQHPEKYSYINKIEHSTLDTKYNGVNSSVPSTPEKQGARIDENNISYPIGTAIKDPCELATTISGQSLSPLNGGFAALRVGIYAQKGTNLPTLSMGVQTRAYFYSSTPGPDRSSTNPLNVKTAYNRLVMPNDPSIYTLAYTRANFMSVRCKKNE